MLLHLPSAKRSVELNMHFAWVGAKMSAETVGSLAILPLVHHFLFPSTRFDAQRILPQNGNQFPMT